VAYQAAIRAPQPARLHHPPAQPPNAIHMLHRIRRHTSFATVLHRPSRRQCNPHSEPSHRHRSRNVHPPRREWEEQSPIIPPPSKRDHREAIDACRGRGEGCSPSPPSSSTTLSSPPPFVRERGGGSPAAALLASDVRHGADVEPGF
jgi:hypothetical protein